jgi:anaerobic selenocysteine-containing dehydrogenase
MPNNLSTTNCATDTRHYRICPLCEACCGLEVRTRDRQVVGIRGFDADVLSHGYVCPKGYALKDLHEDPDRLRTPLVKRNGVHVPVGWDEAFAEIEARLVPLIAQHGRDALALSVGNPAAHKMGLLLYFARLARASGSKNVYSASTLDQMPKQLQSGLMYGHWLSVALPDIERTDFMLILGANPMVSNGSMWTVPDFRGKAKALRERGGRLVVIDPRRTETAPWPMPTTSSDPAPMCFCWRPWCTRCLPKAWCAWATRSPGWRVWMRCARPWPPSRPRPWQHAAVLRQNQFER